MCVYKAACIGVAMGVRDLWKILSKAKRKVDIRELRGKTLAVDLSCWICQFSSVKGTIVQYHVRIYYLNNIIFFVLLK